MYKKIYKYLGLSALLWAYGSCSIQAVGNKDEADQQYQAHNKEMHSLPHNSVSGKKKAVMLLGLPSNYSGYEGGILDDEEVKTIFKPSNFDGCNPGRKEFNYAERLKKELYFMKNTFWQGTYTVEGVSNYSFLPRICCPAGKENSEEPVYIVVPSVEKLLKGIFYHESEVGFRPPAPSDREERILYSKCLESSIGLLNRYMQEKVYSKYDIHALVINYNGDELEMAMDQIREIDIVIRSFGTLLYKEKGVNDKKVTNEEKKYTIQPKVFFLFWCNKAKFAKTTKKALYEDINIFWFLLHCNGYESIVYRQATLFYPFFNAHPLSTVADKEYRQAYAHMPKASFPQKGTERIFLLSIYDQMEKQEKAPVFNMIKTYVTRLNAPISPGRFRFGFGIKCHYISRYENKYKPQCGYKEAVALFLTMQSDIPEVKNPKKIGLDRFAYYYDNYHGNGNTTEDAFLNDLNLKLGDGLPTAAIEKKLLSPNTSLIGKWSGNVLQWKKVNSHTKMKTVIGFCCLLGISYFYFVYTKLSKKPLDTTKEEDKHLDEGSSATEKQSLEVTPTAQPVKNANNTTKQDDNASTDSLSDTDKEQENDTSQHEKNKPTNKSETGGQKLLQSFFHFNAVVLLLLLLILLGIGFYVRGKGKK